VPRYQFCVLDMATGVLCSFGILMWEMLTGERPYKELLGACTDKRQRDKLILTQVRVCVWMCCEGAGAEACCAMRIQLAVSFQLPQSQPAVSHLNL
jgi:hypothetical protein